jgi:trigger factor
VATRVGRKPAQVRKDFERNGQMPLVRSDLRKRKALEWLIEHVEIVDEHGSAVDRSALQVDEEGDEERSVEPEDEVGSDGAAADPQPEVQADAAATDASSTEETE